MGELTLKLARLFAIGMILAVISLVGIAGAEGVAKAATGPTAVAQLTKALLDAGAEGAYNDVVTQIYSGADNPVVQKQMQAGAKSHCGGKLVAEDFTCVPGSYNDHTDYRPVR